MSDARKISVAGVALLAAGGLGLVLLPTALGQRLAIAAAALGAALLLVAGSARAPEPPPEEPFAFERTPRFLVEPWARRAEAADPALPTTLGLCAATAWLAGSFTLFVGGPPALAVFCLVGGGVLVSAARRTR